MYKDICCTGKTYSFKLNKAVRIQLVNYIFGCLNYQNICISRYAQSVLIDILSNKHLAGAWQMTGPLYRVGSMASSA